MSEVTRYGLYSPIELFGRTHIQPDVKGNYVRLEDYSVLHQKLDALAAECEKLAVECAAAKIAIQYANNAGFRCLLNTPDVDAYLNSVRADAVQALWDDSLNDVGQVLEEIRAYDDASEAAGIVHSEIQERVRDFAAQLRAGEAK